MQDIFNQLSQLHHTFISGSIGTGKDLLASFGVKAIKQQQPELTVYVMAIEAVRKNIVELSISDSNSSKQNNSKNQNSTEDLVKHEHHYSIPIVNELGDLMSDMRTFVLFVGLISAIGVVFISLTKPRLCDVWENRNGIYENRSLYCQMLTKFSQFFEDYQQVK